MKEKRAHFSYCLFCAREILTFVFSSMYSLLTTLSKYTYFSISENTTSYTFLLVSKIVESLQCILKRDSAKF